MSGYRSGQSPTMARADFNAKAKALSERLGPVGKPEARAPRSKPNRTFRTMGGRTPYEPKAAASIDPATGDEA